jgi:hypothetical protein
MKEFERQLVMFGCGVICDGFETRFGALTNKDLRNKVKGEITGVSLALTNLPREQRGAMGVDQ